MYCRCIQNFQNDSGNPVSRLCPSLRFQDQSADRSSLYRWLLRATCGLVAAREAGGCQELKWIALVLEEASPARPKPLARIGPLAQLVRAHA
jgi:hypothetical protein